MSTASVVKLRHYNGPALQFHAASPLDTDAMVPTGFRTKHLVNHLLPKRIYHIPGGPSRKYNLSWNRSSYLIVSSSFNFVSQSPGGISVSFQGFHFLPFPSILRPISPPQALSTLAYLPAITPLLVLQPRSHQLSSSNSPRCARRSGRKMSLGIRETKIWIWDPPLC